MTQTATYDELRAAYLHSLQQHASDAVCSAARQALALFDTLLDRRNRAQPFVNVPLSTLDNFLDYLQQHHSIETEHLYLRAVLDFFTFSAERVGRSDRAQLTAHADELQARRRTKSHDIHLPPLAIIHRVLTTARDATPPTDAATERAHLQFLRDRAFILLLADTGLRSSEITSLRRANRTPESAICLPDGSQYTLSPAARNALTAYLNARQALDGRQHVLLGDLPLFARHDKRAGNRILPLSRWTAANIVNYWVDRTLNAAEQAELAAQNLSLSPHTFRHYYVLTTLQEAESIDAAQALARHKDRSTTRRYRHIIPDPPSDKPTTS